MTITKSLLSRVTGPSRAEQRGRLTSTLLHRVMVLTEELAEERGRVAELEELIEELENRPLRRSPFPHLRTPADHFPPPPGL